MKYEDYQYRQGDVYLFRVESLDLTKAEKAKPVGKNHVLAYGEATGHCHAFKKDECELFLVNDNIVAVARKHGITDDRAVTHGLRIVVDNARLSHGTPSRAFSDPDHTPIDIPMGDYIVLRPREYSDEDEFKVIAD